MRLTPEFLDNEHEKLFKEYLSQFDDDEILYDSDEEEREFNQKLHNWIYDHASELLNVGWTISIGLVTKDNSAMERGIIFYGIVLL